MEYKKALIVDDSRAARFSLRKTLEKLHIHVDCVESGENALSYLRSSAQALPDIIFMDNLMPGMNGFNTSKAINEQPSWSHIPILMCSATEGPDSWPKAQQHGISGILSKPASVEDVSQFMQQLFHVPIEVHASHSHSSSSPPINPQKLVTKGNQDISQRQLQEFQQELLALSQQALAQFQQQLANSVSTNTLPTSSGPTSSGTTTLSTHETKALLDTVKIETVQLLEERAQKITLRVQQALNDQLHQLHQQSDQKKMQDQQLLEQVKSTAQFVATHHSIETAERIAKETAHQLLQGELASMTAASKQQWETQIQTKFLQLQKRHTIGLYLSLAISVAALLFSVLM